MRYYRVLSVLIGMTIGATAGMLIVARCLPRELRVRQRVPFRLVDPSAVGRSSWQLFALQQQRLLGELAQASGSDLRPYVSWSVEREGTEAASVTVTLAGPNDESLGRAFDALIGGYVKRFERLGRELPLDGTAEGTLEVPKRPPGLADDPCAAALRDRIGRAVRECGTLAEQFAALQGQTNELKSRVVGLDEALAWADPPSDDGKFNRFVAEALEARHRADAELQQWQDRARQLHAEAARLDVQAGQADDAEVLTQLNGKRQRLATTIAEKEEEVQRRGEMLAEHVRDEQWPAYRAELAERRAVLQREADSRAAVRDMAGTALGQMREQVAGMIQRLLRMEAPAAAALELPLPQAARTLEFSCAQLLWVIAAGLIGALVGWLVGPRDEQATQLEPVALEEQVQSPGRAWSPQYDVVADRVVRLRESVLCPVVLVSALGEVGSTPRPAVNLAIALSRREIDVLLVEGQAGRNDLQGVFDLEDGPGLGQLLRGEAQVEQIVHEVQLARLQVVLSGAGEVPEDGWALSAAWSDLKQRFDVIVVQHTSALEEGPTKPLLRCADGVVGLVENRRRRAVGRYRRRVEKTLSSCEAELLGFVFV